MNLIWHSLTVTEIFKVSILPWILFPLKCRLNQEPSLKQLRLCRDNRGMEKLELCLEKSYFSFHYPGCQVIASVSQKTRWGSPGRLKYTNSLNLSIILCTLICPGMYSTGGAKSVESVTSACTHGSKGERCFLCNFFPDNFLINHWVRMCTRSVNYKRFCTGDNFVTEEMNISCVWYWYWTCQISNIFSIIQPLLILFIFKLNRKPISTLSKWKWKTRI